MFVLLWWLWSLWSLWCGRGAYDMCLSKCHSECNELWAS